MKKIKFKHTVLIADGKTNKNGNCYNIKEISIPKKIPVYYINDINKQKQEIGFAKLRKNKYNIIAHLKIKMEYPILLHNKIPIIRGYVKQITNEGDILGLDIASIDISMGPHNDDRIPRIQTNKFL